jgi:2-dehydro-3-deoxyphosphogluconate aldolase/(4S)-4-hydroxy-2-oxoglutarate aldolase
MSILDRISSKPILPVIVIDDAERAVPLAEALLAGGLDSIEITFRTDAAADAIRRIRETLPEMCVGAGTVLRLDQVKRALDAGTQFALAPGLNEKIVRECRGAALPFIPGVMTPSEIDCAYELGCRHMKFFPAETAGGPAALKAMNAPFKHLKIRYCPTGVVTLKNMGDYLALDEIFAIGGSWLATREQIAEKRWALITDQVKAALEKAAETRPAK